MPDIQTTGPGPEIEPGVAGTGLTSAVIAFDVAGEPLTQAWLVVRTQVTTSPLFKLELV